MRRKNLAEAQLKMKRRITREKAAAKNTIRPLELRRRRPLADEWRNCRRITRSAVRRENRGSLCSDAASGGEKYRKRLRARQDFISETLEVEDEFITNVPIYESEPPSGEPWTYYMFTTAVIRLQKTTHRFVALVVLTGETKEAIDEALLELVTRPGVLWLEPSEETLADP
jgi:hypothetical protein